MFSIRDKKYPEDGETLDIPSYWNCKFEKGTTTIHCKESILNLCFCHFKMGSIVMIPDVTTEVRLQNCRIDDGATIHTEDGHIRLILGDCTLLANGLIFTGTGIRDLHWYNRYNETTFPKSMPQCQKLYVFDETKGIPGKEIVDLASLLEIVISSITGPNC